MLVWLAASFHPNSESVQVVLSTLACQSTTLFAHNSCRRLPSLITPSIYATSAKLCRVYARSDHVLSQLSSSCSLLCIQVPRVQLPDLPALLLLWMHESARVFRDRLCSAADRSWFDELCAAQLRTHLNCDWRAEEFRDILFGDYTSGQYAGHSCQLRKKRWFMRV